MKMQSSAREISGDKRDSQLAQRFEQLRTKHGFTLRQAMNSDVMLLKNDASGQISITMDILEESSSKKSLKEVTP